MDVAKRTVATYLALTAVVVAANVVLTPVYHNGNPDYPVWEIVNYFMAVGAVIALAVSCMRCRSARAESGGGDIAAKLTGLRRLRRIGKLDRPQEQGGQTSPDRLEGGLGWTTSICWWKSKTG